MIILTSPPPFFWKYFFYFHFEILKKKWYFHFEIKNFGPLTFYLLPMGLISYSRVRGYNICDSLEIGGLSIYLSLPLALRGVLWVGVRCWKNFGKKWKENSIRVMLCDKSSKEQDLQKLRRTRFTNQMLKQFRLWFYIVHFVHCYFELVNTVQWYHITLWSAIVSINKNEHDETTLTKVWNVKIALSHYSVAWTFVVTFRIKCLTFRSRSEVKLTFWVIK